jgi:hypothetical protein
MTTAEHSIMELPEDLADAARTLFRAGGVAATLQSVVQLASECLVGAEFVSAVLAGGAPGTALSSEPIAAELAAVQLGLREGPIRDVIAHGGLIYVEDLGKEFRWPQVAVEADRIGVRSLLVLRLSAGETLGALMLCNRVPMAYGASERAKALSFATVAAHALSVGHVRDEGQRRVEELQRALTTRELIGQAQGILMERERVTANQAFDMLRMASQSLNVKLLEVALRLIETGESPLTFRLVRRDHNA